MRLISIYVILIKKNCVPYWLKFHEFFFKFCHFSPAKFYNQILTKIECSILRLKNSRYWPCNTTSTEVLEEEEESEVCLKNEKKKKNKKKKHLYYY